jgi:hypothetical protein
MWPEMMDTLLLLLLLHDHAFGLRICLLGLPAFREPVGHQWIHIASPSQVLCLMCEPMVALALYLCVWLSNKKRAGLCLGTRTWPYLCVACDCSGFMCVLPGCMRAGGRAGAACVVFMSSLPCVRNCNRNLFVPSCV